MTLHPVILFAFHPVIASLNSDRYQSDLALWSCLPQLTPLPQEQAVVTFCVTSQAEEGFHCSAAQRLVYHSNIYT